eukprot:scaffold72240_cov69-Phaeocystis_antarctica.AAC.1
MRSAFGGVLVQQLQAELSALGEREAELEDELAEVQEEAATARHAAQAAVAVAGGEGWSAEAEARAEAAAEEAEEAAALVEEVSEELATLREQSELLRTHLAAAELPPPPTEADAGMPRSRSSTLEKGWYEPFAAPAADDYVPFGAGTAGAAQAGAAGQHHVEAQPTSTQPTSSQPLHSDGAPGATNGPAAGEEVVDPNEAALASFDLWEEGA